MRRIMLISICGFNDEKGKKRVTVNPILKFQIISGKASIMIPNEEIIQSLAITTEFSKLRFL
jgi:hypothetical protein